MCGHRLRPCVLAMAAQIVGQVYQLLPCALRVQRIMDAGEGGRDSNEMYIAPLQEVSADVLQAAWERPFLSPSRPGFRGAANKIYVLFRCSGGPSTAVGGDRRASEVRPLTVDQQWPQPLASSALAAGEDEGANEQGATATHDNISAICAAPESVLEEALIVSAILPKAFKANLGQLLQGPRTRQIARTRQWMSLCLDDARKSWRRCARLGHAQQATTSLETLADIAVSTSDGELMCLIVVLAAAGIGELGGPQDTASASEQGASSSSLSQLHGGGCGADEQLRGVIATCLSSLDLGYSAIFNRMLPVLRHLEHCTKMSRGGLHDAAIESLLASALKEPPAPPRFGRKVHRRRVHHAAKLLGPCAVPNCRRTAHCPYRPGDAIAPSGPRCLYHARALCSMPGCTAVHAQIVKMTDARGACGPRCDKHGPRLCSVSACGQRALARAFAADNYGTAGLRCRQHWAAASCTRVCSAPGCCFRGTIYVRGHGVGGSRRCAWHGGAKRCVAYGCYAPARGTVTSQDDFGPPGYRCSKHHGICLKRKKVKCNVVGCDRTRSLKLVRAADALGQAGLRCCKHRLLDQMSQAQSTLQRPQRHSERTTLPPHSSAAAKEGTSAQPAPTAASKCCTACGRSFAWGKTKTADHLGPSGPRCFLHGGHTCNVDGCLNRPVRRVRADDQFGSSGIRCHPHSRDAAVMGRLGGRKTQPMDYGHCSIPGCLDRVPYPKVFPSDEFGPAGSRCRRHNRCSVRRCFNRRQVMVRVADEHGPPGGRCKRHSGQQC